MDDDMNTAELLVAKAEESRTLEILRILDRSKDLDEAKEKIEALLK